ncbi:neurotrypsin-like isoform X3 [Penaeus chinensis]|uniref:neurotrypsin-like isoform X3 n=1 Tax=Penaeus chinensis TaxID=139456 RepID=UPI001FB75BCA|nr:neurotrypsin-like isoform X3 [Penaeus chinensis]
MSLLRLESLSRLLLLAALLRASVSAQDVKDIDQLRLMGSENLYEGNVQVESGGVWGYVCDDGFGFPEADVVCKQLGFESALSFTRNDQFGSNAAGERRRGEQTKFWLDGLRCGNVSDLRNCSSKPLGIHDCVSSEIAGVVCRRATDGSDTNGTSVCSADEFRCEDDSRCIPRSYVCDDDPDCADASDDRSELCKDVGVVRLVDGNKPLNVPGMAAGIVLVKRRGVWGTICDDGLRDADAKVLCRNLGYTGGWALPFYVGYLGENSASSVLSRPECVGDERWVGACPGAVWSAGICRTQKFDLSVLCSEGGVDVRVAGGRPRAGGRLEVRLPGSDWASVCDAGFDDLDAQVVCRTLGYEGEAVATRGADPPGPVWNVALDCTGAETRLHQCRLRLVNARCDTAAFLTCAPARQRTDAQPHYALPSECGLAAENSDLYIGRLAKVRGGAAARRFGNPWMVILVTPRELRFGKALCGGAIITEDHVLTSANCFDSFGSHSVVVRAGDYNVDFVENGFEEEFDIDKVWIHEQFKELWVNDNSIALVKIQRKNGRGFRFTERVRPICLPSADDSYENLDACSVAGFGSRGESEQQPTQPREASVSVVSDALCEERFGGSALFSSTDICLSDPSGFVSSCPGDLGGPLACTANGRNTLYGIISTYSSCSSLQTGPFKGVRVSKYIRWILEKIDPTSRRN